MSENEINELIKKVVEILRTASRTVYIIFGCEWSNHYYLLFDEMKNMREYQFKAVIPDQWKENGNLQKLCETVEWQEIVCQSQRETCPAGGDITVFPCFSRSLVAKTALGIDDTFETKWIRKTMEQGGRIVLLKNGLDRFTGKEPGMYTNTILEYYRILLQFNIELVGSLVEIDRGNNE